MHLLQARINSCELVDKLVGEYEECTYGIISEKLLHIVVCVPKVSPLQFELRLTTVRDVFKTSRCHVTEVKVG